MNTVFTWGIEGFFTLSLMIVMSVWSLRYSNKNDLIKDLHGRVWWWGLEIVWVLWTLGLIERIL